MAESEPKLTRARPRKNKLPQSANSECKEHRDAHNLGLAVQALIDKKASRKAAIREVARKRNLHISRVKYAHAFSQKFDEARLILLGQLRTNQHKHLPWDCVRNLSGLNRKEIDRVLRWIKRNGYSPDAIKLALKRPLEFTPCRGSHAKIPRSADECLRQIETACVLWLRRNDQAWSERSFRRQQSTPIDFKTADSKTMTRVRNLLGELAQAAKKLKKRLDVVEPAVER